MSTTERPFVGVFPAIVPEGKGIPGCDLRDDDLERRLKEAPPHWLYHLEAVVKNRAKGRQRFTSVKEPWLRHLAERLDVSDYFDIYTMERYPDRTDRDNRTAHSKFAFPIPLEFGGRSWCLAVAVALKAASRDCTMYPWVVCSGELPVNLDSDLRLEPVGSIEEKIELCLGRKPEYDIEHVVNRMYQQHPATVHSHGPRERRAVSGKVRLLLVPTRSQNRDDFPRERMQRLGMELVASNWDQLRHHDLPGRIEQLRQGGLLVVQVPSVWHALVILGLADEDDAPLGILEEEAYLFRIPKEGRRASWSPTADSQLKRKTREAQRELDAELVNVHNPYARLQAILEQCVKKVDGCVSGLICRVGENKTGLPVVARFGESVAAVPHSILVGQGLRKKLLDGEATKPALTREDFLEDLKCLFPPQTRQGNEGPEGFASCLLLPLKDGGTVLGILGLHREVEGPFDPLDQGVVEQLAVRAAREVAALVTDEKRTQERPPAERVRETAEYAGKLPLAEACEYLAQELAKDVKATSHGYRAVVRLLSHDRGELAVLGMDGEAHVCPPELRQQRYRRQTPSASKQALEAAKDNYFLLNKGTRPKKNTASWPDVHRQAAAHLAVVLRSGNEEIGVVGIDYDPTHANHCNLDMARKVEDLAALYAGHIHSFSSDQLCAKLATDLAPLADDALSSEAMWEFLDGTRIPEEANEGAAKFLEALRKFLEATGSALSVKRGSLYLRNRSTGHFDLLLLDTQTVQRDGKASNETYEPNEGRTGWVAFHNKPLRIDDCSNLRQVAKIHPRLNPSSKQPCYDPETQRLAYLGVPIRVGRDDVHGVLRFVCVTDKPGEDGSLPAVGKTCFNAFDEDLARAAAAQLGHVLYKIQQRKQSQLLDKLSRQIDRARSRTELSRAVSDTVQEGVGSCVCLVRVVDRQDLGEGEPEEGLDRLFLSEPSQSDIWPLFRSWRESIAGLIRKDKETIWIRNSATDERALLETGAPGGAWWERFGSAIIAPMRAEGASIPDWLVPSQDGTKDPVLGTLAAIRTHPDVFLKADVEFVQKVARQTIRALARLAQTEEFVFREGLLWAVVTYLLERDRDGALVGLLEEVCAQMVSVEDNEMSCYWVFNPDTRQFELGGEAIDLPLREHLPVEAVAGAFKDKSWIVLSNPAPDRRLDFLMKDSAPLGDQNRLKNYQRATVYLDKTESRIPLPPVLFFLAVRPPHRLSYNRVVQFHQTLVATLLAMRRPPR